MQDCFEAILRGRFNLGRTAGSVAGQRAAFAANYEPAGSPLDATAVTRSSARSEPRELLPKGSSDAIGDRLNTTRALSSAVEHTLYMGEVARSIRAAPTTLLLARQGTGPAGDD